MSRSTVPFGLALLGLACTPHVEAEPTAPAAETAPKVEPRSSRPKQDPRMGETLACEARFEGPQLRVDGRDMGLELGVVYPEEEMRLRTHPWDEQSILVAVGDVRPGAFMSPEQQGILYRVPCADPEDHEEVVRIDGADFAWSVPSADRTRLYFSYTGVGVLDFAAGDWSTLTEPVEYEECWMGADEGEATQGYDYVDGWLSDDALRIYTGGPCGFEAEWEGGVYALELEGRPRRREPAHVGSVLDDAKGRLWVGDGGLCEDAETYDTRGSRGLWHSDDRGETWNLVSLPIRGEHGIDGLWRFDVDPQLLLARVECCYGSAADFCEGGGLFISRDSGDHWQALDPTAAQPNPEDWGPPRKVGMEGKRLFVGYETIEGGEGLVTDDRGRNWQMDGSFSAFEEPMRRVELDGHVFEPGPEGLVRISPDGTRTVVLMPGLDESTRRME